LGRRGARVRTAAKEGATPHDPGDPPSM